MKLATTLLALGLTIALLSGCSSTVVNKNTQRTEVIIPVIMDPTVTVGDTPVHGTSSVYCLLYLWSWGDGELACSEEFRDYSELGGILSDILHFFYSPGELSHLAKQAAVYNATEDSQYDMVVCPQYTVHSKDYLIIRKISCTVKGFPGKITKVTPVNGPMPAINLNVNQKDY